ncbi:heavy-metal-associated domain-containing protein [Galbibacter sp.]|jgi:copper chaperone CopZ|uniref:heavy-metal-associated domain-containing protein n=1 Tax=Galbibacter sp. TaxID=2918471 RepID=UPI003A8CCD1C
MKLRLVLVFLLISFTITAQDKNKNQTILVDGNCQMCQKRIQNAAIKVKGVKYASWDIPTNQLSLVYNEKKCDIKTIHLAIAEAGHDTDLYKAKEASYQNLPPCCLYRDPATKEMEHH